MPGQILSKDALYILFNLFKKDSTLSVSMAAVEAVVEIRQWLDEALKEEAKKDVGLSTEG